MIFEAIAIASVVIAAIAVYKHGSVASALASAKKEAALIDTYAAKVEGDVKTGLAAISARLKAL
jgi:hypothetical protein